ncbi:MAG TPA: membrane dipeptidase, partial [Xanthomonadales bacterium]|nr:membrane dipeptidase [Xanthomonadales bacterium]
MKLDRRQFLQLSTVAMGGFTLAPALMAAADAKSLYRQSIIIDGLGFPGSMDTAPGGTLSAEEILDVAASGLSATHVTVGEVGSMDPLLAFEKIIRDITRWDGEIAANSKVLQSVRTAEDVHNAKADGKTGLIYGLQDGVSFEDDPGRLAALHHAGIRVIQPTYNRRNLLG